MKNNILVGIVVAVVVLVGASLVLPSEVRTVVEKITVGSASSPSVVGGCMEVNGVTSCYDSQVPRAATSTAITNATFCSFKIQATSTLVVATLKGTNDGYANTFEIGMANDHLATTTRLGWLTVGSGLPFEMVASTSVRATGLVEGILIPGDFVNFKVATGTMDSTFGITAGKCVVEMRNL